MNKRTVGIIVGRFESRRLTPGHVHLINTALLQNDEVVLFVGEGSVVNGMKYPIPYIWRQSMILSDNRVLTAGRRLTIRPIKDRGDNEAWCKALQEEVSNIVDVSNSILRCYGSRDSTFLSAFAEAGVEVEQVQILPLQQFSASEEREQISKQFPSGRESDDQVREGMIMAAYSRYAEVKSTVDIIILDRDENRTLGVWLGRKKEQKLFRLIGGYTDPDSNCDEEDAIREAEEETNLIVDDLEYVGNTKVDDYRYRGERDKIRTRLFVGKVVGSTNNEGPRAKDDIEEIKFVTMDEFWKEELVPEHMVLKEMLDKWILKGNAGKLRL